MKLSVIVPTINSSRIIRKNLEEIERVLFSIPELDDFEVLAAAQTSKDNTFDILKGMAGRRIKPVFIIPKGKGVGLTLGIKKASFDWVLMVDDDIPYDIKRFILLAYKKYIREADIIIASRYAPGAKYNSPLKRKIASFGYRLLIKLFFGIPQKDTQAGMKLIKKSAFDVMGYPKEHGYAWDTELLYKANLKRLKIAEVPVELINSEKNQLNLRKAVPSILRDLVKLRMRV